MAPINNKEKIEQALKRADIIIDGNRPWDIQIHRPEFYDRALKNLSLGLGESYMDGWWDCENLDEFFFRMLRHVDAKNIYRPVVIARFLASYFLTNQQNKFRSMRVAEQHYNLDNVLYRHMLGETMAYTCGYWKEAASLDDAQNAKYDLICRKLNLQKGDKVLELGCGWGGFARYAAQHYSAELTSINISSEQVKYAREICVGFPVTIFECDYRDVDTYNPNRVSFDKVVSIGMCEHVGYKNYPVLMDIVRQNVKEDGLFLLHTIGKNATTYFSDPWITKYIFPGGMLPSIAQLSKAAERRFIIEDLHNIGSDYDKTLMAWDHNFVTSWPQLQSNYDERFYRMWRYYLLSCAGAFRSRDLQLWQLVMSPKGVLNGYASLR